MLRIAIPRIRFTQRASCLVPVRYQSEGAIRNDSKSGFAKKEKAQEDQWVKTHESEKLKQLREELSKHQKQVDETRRKIDEETSNTKS